MEKQLQKVNKTYLKWLDRILNTKTPWTENEIIYFRKYLGTLAHNNQLLFKSLKSEFDRIGLYSITQEQSLKGINWLNKYAFKSNGQLRNAKGMVFGNREASIIKQFKEFRFTGLHPIGHSWTYFAPIYEVIAIDGRSFEYSTNMGQIEVIS